MSTPRSALRNDGGSARSPSAICTRTRWSPRRRGSRTRQRTRLALRGQAPQQRRADRARRTGEQDHRAADDDAPRRALAARGVSTSSKPRLGLIHQRISDGGAVARVAPGVDEQRRDRACSETSLARLRPGRVADHEAASGTQRLARHPAQLAVALLRQMVDQVEDRHHVQVLPQSELEHVALPERDPVREPLLRHDLPPHGHARRQVEHRGLQPRVTAAHRHREGAVGARRRPPCGAGSSTGTRRHVRVVLAAGRSRTAADVGLPALGIVPALLVHRVGRAVAHRLRRSMAEHLDQCRSACAPT